MPDGNDIEIEQPDHKLEKITEKANKNKEENNSALVRQHDEAKDEKPAVPQNTALVVSSTSAIEPLTSQHNPLWKMAETAKNKEDIGFFVERAIKVDDHNWRISKEKQEYEFRLSKEKQEYEFRLSKEKQEHDLNIWRQRRTFWQRFVLFIIFFASGLFFIWLDYMSKSSNSLGYFLLGAAIHMIVPNYVRSVLRNITQTVSDSLPKDNNGNDNDNDNDNERKK